LRSQEGTIRTFSLRETCTIEGGGQALTIWTIGKKGKNICSPVKWAKVEKKKKDLNPTRGGGESTYRARENRQKKTDHQQRKTRGRVGVLKKDRFNISKKKQSIKQHSAKRNTKKKTWRKV